MFYKIGKKIFLYLIHLLQAIQVCLIFLALFTVLYWVLQIANVSFIAPVAPLFEAIKAFTHVYYKRIVVIDQASIDFSFLLASCAMLIVVWAIKIVVEQIQDIEKKYDKFHEGLRKQNEDIFNKNLEREIVNQEMKNNKIVAFIKFNAVNTTKDALYDRDATAGKETKEKEMIFDLIEILEEFPDAKKEVFNNGVLITFDSFEKINQILYSLNLGLEEIRRKYFSEHWLANFHLGFEVYAKDAELGLKIKRIEGLVNIGLNNEMVCLGTFKERYAIVKNKNYSLVEKGVYQIAEDYKEVFCIKSLR